MQVAEEKWMEMLAGKLLGGSGGVSLEATAQGPSAGLLSAR